MMDNIPRAVGRRCSRASGRGHRWRWGWRGGRRLRCQSTIATIDRLRADPRLEIGVLFLDCATHELERRYDRDAAAASDQGGGPPGA
ncbi:hypothetical protein AB5I41_04940 [Sphingomonas sp. MMS24-JH45]